MSIKLINKYTVQLKRVEKKQLSFWELAKKHFVDKKGIEKNLAYKTDEILYGKR